MTGVDLLSASPSIPFSIHFPSSDRPVMSRLPARSVWMSWGRSHGHGATSWHLRSDQWSVAWAQAWPTGRGVQEVQFLRNETSVAIELGLLCATCVPGPTGMESAGVPMFRRHWRCCALQYRPLSKMNCKASCPRPRIALPATKQHGIGFGASNAAGIHEREVNRE